METTEEILTLPEVKTLQGWVDWAEFIDNNTDTDESQWGKKLISTESEIPFLRYLKMRTDKLSLKGLIDMRIKELL